MIDVVSADEMGKLPDLNVAESAQRIPGSLSCGPRETATTTIANAAASPNSAQLAMRARR